MSSDSTMDLIMENAQVVVTDVLGRVERSDPNPEGTSEMDEAVGHTLIDQIVKAMVESPRAEKVFKRAGVDISDMNVDAALRSVMASTLVMFMADMGISVQDKASSKASLKAMSR